MQKDIIPLKRFWKSRVRSLSMNIQKKEGFYRNWIGRVMLLEEYNYLSLFFFLEVQTEKSDSGFPKTFHGGYLFVFVEYRCSRSLKLRTKLFKNYILIYTEFTLNQLY